MHANGCERRLGTAHSDHDLVALLSAAGLAAPERVLDDPGVIEWQGARAHVYQAALTERARRTAPARQFEVADTELAPDLLEPDGRPSTGTITHPYPAGPCSSSPRPASAVASHADRAVDALTEQIGVSVVPGVFLDHVDEHPAQRHRPAP